MPSKLHSLHCSHQTRSCWQTRRLDPRTGGRALPRLFWTADTAQGCASRRPPSGGFQCQDVSGSYLRSQPPTSGVPSILSFHVLEKRLPWGLGIPGAVGGVSVACGEDTKSHRPQRDKTRWGPALGRLRGAQPVPRTTLPQLSTPALRKPQATRTGTPTQKPRAFFLSAVRRQPPQSTTSWVAQTSRSSFSPCAGGQRSEIKVSRGRAPVEGPSCLFQLLGAQASPAGGPSLWSLLCPHVASPPCLCQRSLCLPFVRTPDDGTT